MEQQILLLFRIATRRLALPLGDVKRVAPVPLLHAPVGAPHFVEGFFDYQGAPTAVIRLERLLGLDEQTLGLYTPLLILADEDPPTALHVARVDAIQKIPAARVQPIGNDETFNACVIGRVNDQGETIYLLAKKELLLAAEREKLAAHRVMKQRRLVALEQESVHAA
jgi:chemotaxis signal transduction protein